MIIVSSFSLASFSREKSCGYRILDGAQETEDTQGQDKQESITEPPDNELIDFDAF